MTSSSATPGDWRQLAEGLGVLEDEAVVVDVGNQRRHRVVVLGRGDAWEISGMAATAADLEKANVSPFDLWRLNEHRTLTGCVIETDGSESPRV